MPPSGLLGIMQLIYRVRWQLRRSQFSIGLAKTLAIYFMSVVGLIIIDLSVPLATPFRVAALVFIVMATLITFFAFAVRPFCRRVSITYVAQLIEAQIPNMHSRLISCADLASYGFGDASPPLCQQLIDETRVLLQNFRPTTVIDGRRIRQSWLTAALSFGLFCVVYFVFAGRVPAVLTRIVFPFREIPPPSSVSYDVQPGDQTVRRGEDVVIRADVKSGRPDLLFVEFTSVKSATSSLPEPVRSYEMVPDGSGWRFVRTQVIHPFEYRVSGGGTYSRSHRISVVDPPHVSRVRVELNYPSPMGFSMSLNPLSESSEIVGPSGTEVVVTATTSGYALEGDIKLIREEDEGAHKEQLFQLSKTGEWSVRFPLQAAGAFHIVLRRQIGGTDLAMPKHRYRVVPEIQPTVRFSNPHSRDIRITSRKPISLTICADDDYGLKDVTFYMRPGRQEEFTATLIKEYQMPCRNDSLVHSIDVPSLGLKSGDVIRFRVEARDRMQHRSSTAEYTATINENDAADKRLEEFIDSHRPLTDQIKNVIDRQLEIHQKLDEVERKRGALTQAERTALAGQQQENSKAVGEIIRGLQAAIKEGSELELLPPEFPKAAQELLENVERSVRDPLEQLATDFENAALKTNKLRESSAAIREDLRRLQDLFSEMTDEERKLQTDPESSLNELRETRNKIHAMRAEKQLEDTLEGLRSRHDELRNLVEQAPQTTPDDTWNQTVDGKLQELALLLGNRPSTFDSQFFAQSNASSDTQPRELQPDAEDLPTNDPGPTAPLDPKKPQTPPSPDNKTASMPPMGDPKSSEPPPTTVRPPDSDPSKSKHGTAPDQKKSPTPQPPDKKAPPMSPMGDPKSSGPPPTTVRPPDGDPSKSKPGTAPDQKKSPMPQPPGNKAAPMPPIGDPKSSEPPPTTVRPRDGDPSKSEPGAAPDQNKSPMPQSPDNKATPMPPLGDRKSSEPPPTTGRAPDGDPSKSKPGTAPDQKTSPMPQPPDNQAAPGGGDLRGNVSPSPSGPAPGQKKSQPRKNRDPQPAQAGIPGVPEQLPPSRPRAGNGRSRIPPAEIGVPPAVPQQPNGTTPAHAPVTARRVQQLHAADKMIRAKWAEIDRLIDRLNERPHIANPGSVRPKANRVKEPSHAAAAGSTNGAALDSDEMRKALSLGERMQTGNNPPPNLPVPQTGIFLILPPRMQQAMLQGTKDVAPRGYQAIVANYFRSLTDLKSKD